MFLYVEDTKNSTRLLELVMKFNNIVGNKINSQKAIVFLYINNKFTEKEIRKTIPLPLISRKLNT